MSAMRLFTCFLQLLAGLSLPAASPQQWDIPPENGTAEIEVLPFQEVWGRSFCRSLEKLVDVSSEYPGEVEHMFSPSCVSLRRCTGCCGDENLHCVAVETTNVTMQLLKIKSGEQPSYMELAFTEHVRCECRPRREKMKPERRRLKGRGKRKREKQRPRDCHHGETDPQDFGALRRKRGDYWKIQSQSHGHLTMTQEQWRWGGFPFLS